MYEVGTVRCIKWLTIYPHSSSLQFPTGKEEGLYLVPDIHVILVRLQSISKKLSHNGWHNAWETCLTQKMATILHF